MTQNPGNKRNSPWHTKHNGHRKFCANEIPEGGGFDVPGLHPGLTPLSDGLCGVTYQPDFGGCLIDLTQITKLDERLIAAALIARQARFEHDEQAFKAPKDTRHIPPQVKEIQHEAMCALF